MRPARLVASRFTASLVASLQVTHLLTFMHGMWQLLLDHSLPGCLFIALCALVPLLQWRWGLSLPLIWVPSCMPLICHNMCDRQTCVTSCALSAPCHCQWAMQ